MNKKALEETTTFEPQFNGDGLIPCITTSAKTGKVLMFAWMNEDALNKTIQTGEVYYYSRSRGELWHKGATSGNIQKIIEIRTDCDQDCILISAEVQNEQETACHTGRESCFYRKITKDGLIFED